MKRRNQEVLDLCDSDYPKWLWSRSKYLPPLPINILAQFQPSKSAVDRDYDNSPFCAEFHRAIMLQLDMKPQKAMCFLYVFFPKARPKPIKWLAHEYEVDKDTIYEWAHDTATIILNTAKASVKINQMLTDDKFTFA